MNRQQREVPPQILIEGAANQVHWWNGFFFFADMKASMLLLWT